MKNILSSQWKLSGYAVLSCIGFIIGGLIVNPNIFVVWGALTSLVLLVMINIIQVLYKNTKQRSNRQTED